MVEYHFLNEQPWQPASFKKGLRCIISNILLMIPYISRETHYYDRKRDWHELFAAIAEGDRAAFEEFYEASLREIYSFCLRGAKSAHVASDLTQEVYMRLWHNHYRLVRVETPRSYVFRIAANCIADYLTDKKNKRQILELNEYTAIMLPGDVDEAFNRKELIRIIDEAVKELPPQQQKVFRMCKYDGLSYKEIAKILGVKSAAVNFNIVMAMKKVRTHVLTKV